MQFLYIQVVNQIEDSEIRSFPQIDDILYSNAGTIQALIYSDTGQSISSRDALYKYLDENIAAVDLLSVANIKDRDKTKCTQLVWKIMLRDEVKKTDETIKL